MYRRTQHHERQLGWALHAAGFVAVALVVGCYCLFIHNRLVGQKEDDSARIDHLQTLLRQSAQVQRENFALRKEFDSLQKSINHIRQRLPSDLNKDALADELLRVAQQVSLQVDNHHWGPPEAGEGHSHAEISLVCNGSFDSICRFLDEVNQLALITDVSKLRFGASNKDNRYPFQVTFVLYYGIDSHDTEKRKASL